jgi:methylmalonyl-CoA mutase cobalamin-binding domain/chain
MLQNLDERRRLAESLRAMKGERAAEITEDILQEEPVWLERFGEAARTRGTADIEYHLDFLASAIETDSPRAFEEYARWTTRMLAARSIEPELLAHSLLQIPESIGPELTDEEEGTVRDLIEAATAAVQATPVDLEDPREALDDLQSTYLQALLEGRRRAAQEIALDALDAGLGLEELYVDVLQECMHTVGRLWELNQISVADEHMATAITQSVMSEVYQRVPWQDETSGRAVISGVEGELHQLGAHLVADALDVRGWDVRFLGTNLPPRDVLRTVEEHEADVLGLSATILLHAGVVLDMIDEARNRFGDELGVVVGGAAFRMRPSLSEESGANAYAGDVREAVSTFNRLCS